MTWNTGGNASFSGTNQFFNNTGMENDVVFWAGSNKKSTFTFAGTTYMNSGFYFYNAGWTANTTNSSATNITGTLHSYNFKNDFTNGTVTVTGILNNNKYSTSGTVLNTSTVVGQGSTTLAAGAFIVNSGGNATLNNIKATGGVLTINNGGTVTLTTGTKDNTGAGAGTVSINVTNNGTYYMYGNISDSGNIVGNTASTLTIGNNDATRNTVTMTGNITGHKDIKIQQDGTLDMSTGAGSMTGSTNLTVASGGTVKMGTGTLSSTNLTNSGAIYLYSTTLGSDINKASSKTGTVHIANNNTTTPYDAVNNSTSKKNICADNIVVETNATLTSAADNLKIAKYINVESKGILNLEAGTITGAAMPAAAPIRNVINVQSEGKININDNVTISGNSGSGTFAGMMYVNGGTVTVAAGKTLTVSNNSVSGGNDCGFIEVEGAAGGLLDVKGNLIMRGNTYGTRSPVSIEMYGINGSSPQKSTVKLTGTTIELDSGIGQIGNAPSSNARTNTYLYFGDGTNVSTTTLKGTGTTNVNARGLYNIGWVEINKNATLDISGCNGNVNEILTFTNNEGGIFKMGSGTLNASNHNLYNKGNTYLYGTTLGSDINTDKALNGRVHVSDLDKKSAWDTVDNTSTKKNIYANQSVHVMDGGIFKTNLDYLHTSANTQLVEVEGGSANMLSSTLYVVGGNVSNKNATTGGYGGVARI